MIPVYPREQVPDPARGISGVLHGPATKWVSGRIDEENPCRNTGNGQP